jgi:SAM-dependent methyltransferase
MHDLNQYDAVANYADIFKLRGQLYHQAMQALPDARKNEFLSIIGEASISPGMTVVDVPSGGAYISRYLSEVDLIGLEVTELFAELAAQQGQNVALYENDHFPLKDASVDRVLSIAGLHHVHDKTAVFSEMRRVIDPAGRIVVADVDEDSFVRRFLDDFVGPYSETGHSGWYFGDSTRTQLDEAGLHIVADQQLEYLWCAADLNQLAEFCRLLFGMVKADTQTVAAGIRDYLGTQEFDEQIGLNWQLRCFTCKPRTKCGRLQ